MALSTTPSISSVFIRSPHSNYITCSEPSPDAVYDEGSSGGLSLSLIAVGGDDSASEEQSTSEVEMAGRTPGVLYARELFFRTCEFSQNYKLSKDEALALFRQTLSLVGRGWNTEASNTTVTIGDTLSNKETTSFSGSETGNVQNTATSSSTVSNAGARRTPSTQLTQPGTPGTGVTTPDSSTSDTDDSSALF